MKNIPILILAFLALIACQPKEETASDSLPMKVAKAYGFDNLDQVNSIAYTWNVRRDSVTVITRDWKWNLKDRTVYFADSDTSYTYSLDMPADSLPDADKGFVNDKYWLMYPFQLAWDSGYSNEIEENVASPIKGTNSTKLTIVYNNEDVYTPGDAYDLYLDENNMILEWTFRRGNAPEGSTSIWDNVEDFGPIKIATDHINANGDKFIWFTDIEVD